MELYSLGVCSNKLGLLMPGCYAETGFIRKASEERVSNSWKKHSSLTQSLQQLKRGIEILTSVHEYLSTLTFTIATLTANYLKSIQLTRTLRVSLYFVSRIL